MTRVAALTGATLCLAGCGQHGGPRLTGRVVTPVQWKAVFEDWYDGHLGGRHSCAAVVVASSRLPEDPMIYSTVVADFTHYAARVCTHQPDFAAIKVGMADGDVAALAGAPVLPASACWDYPSKDRVDAALEVCFRSGRVTGRRQVPYYAPAGAANP
jgi:hypothetical protein